MPRSKSLPNHPIDLLTRQGLSWHFGFHHLLQPGFSFRPAIS